MKYLTALLVACGVLGAYAEDLVTRSGKVYRNVTVEIAGDGVRVVHDRGVAKVGYADLTDDQRATYGLTEAVADRAQRAAAAEAAKREQVARQQREAVMEEKRLAALPEWIVSGRIARILEDGSLVLLVTPHPYVPPSALRSVGGGYRRERMSQVHYATETQVVITKPQVPKGGFAEGERWQESAVRLGTRQVDGQVLRVYQARERRAK